MLSKRDMCDEYASELQLAAISKLNPVQWLGANKRTYSSSSDESKLPARMSRDKAVPKVCSKQVNNVGVANAYNFGPSKVTKKEAGGGSPSHALKANSKESAKQYSSKENVQNYQVSQMGPSTAPNTGVSGQIFQTNPSANPSTIMPASKSGELITECASTWSVVGFGITSLYLCTTVIFALSADETYTDFYNWILLPICITTMAI